jgi:hypothetical protein
MFEVKTVASSVVGGCVPERYVCRQDCVEVTEFGYSVRFLLRYRFI